MQNRYHQISRRRIVAHWSILVIALITPLLLCAALPILPTHDDWAGTTTPDFKPFFIKEHFLFFGYHWRPFDTWIGYIVGRDPQLLYPAFNHICVVIGHVICALLVYRMLTTLAFNKLARNIVTLFFFVTPATMATVLAVDSQNQVYALMWGLIAFLYYIRSKSHQLVWIILIFIAALSKENGLMWALICPILAYGFDFIDIQKLKKDLLIGIGIMVVYALAIVLLPKAIVIHPEYVPEEMKMVKNIIKFLFSTFVTVDYVYLLHQPSRNLLLAGISLLLASPFMYLFYIRKAGLWVHKKMICTMICLLIAVGPHIVTVFSMMHTYAGLALLSIMVAYAIQSYEQQKYIVVSFILFVLSAIMIDMHLWHASLKSGFVGKEMAQEAIRKTGKPVKSVFVIAIEDDYPKLSSFCVIPYEAFGWGLAARYETNYQWPEVIEDTTIERSADAFRKANELGLEALKKKQYDCVWIVDHEHIDVIKR